MLLIITAAAGEGVACAVGLNCRAVALSAGGMERNRDPNRIEF